MTAKDYILIAQALRDVKCDAPGRWEAKVDIANAIANRLQSENPRFDRGIFLGYVSGNCGPRGGEG